MVQLVAFRVGHRPQPRSPPPRGLHTPGRMDFTRDHHPRSHDGHRLNWFCFESLRDFGKSAALLQSPIRASGARRKPLSAKKKETLGSDCRSSLSLLTLVLLAAEWITHPLVHRVPFFPIDRRANSRPAFRFLLYLFFQPPVQFFAESHRHFKTFSCSAVKIKMFFASESRIAEHEFSQCSRCRSISSADSRLNGIVNVIRNVAPHVFAIQLHRALPKTSLFAQGGCRLQEWYKLLLQP